MNDLFIIFFSIIGGVLPALIWLWFWLREDGRHPEPRRLIIRTFALGMAAVLAVLPLQKIADNIFPGMALPAIAILVILEECSKLVAAWVGGLRTVDDDEPVDPMIYMIAAALGFAALENALFIFGPLSDADITAGIITGNLRFIGSTLLHVVSSAIVGSALGFSFYKSRATRTTYALVGIALAIIFHIAFNLFILHVDNYGLSLAFGSVWVGVILILLVFEKIKTIARLK